MLLQKANKTQKCVTGYLAYTKITLIPWYKGFAFVCQKNACCAYIFSMLFFGSHFSNDTDVSSFKRKV